MKRLLCQFEWVQVHFTSFTIAWINLFVWSNSCVYIYCDDNSFIFFLWKRPESIQLQNWNGKIYLDCHSVIAFYSGCCKVLLMSTVAVLLQKKNERWRWQTEEEKTILEKIKYRSQLCGKKHIIHGNYNTK